MIKQLQSNILNLLDDSGWRARLRSFLLSTDFENLLAQLIELKDQGKRFTPSLKTAFRPFAECAEANLRVVIFNDSPYCGFTPEGKPRADGLAFSCGNHTGKLEEDLIHLMSAIGEPRKDSFEKDLSPWSRQGVLLLNTSPTIGKSQKETHHKIWEDFMSFLSDTLNTTHRNLAIVFIGPNAQSLLPLFDEDEHLLISMENPWKSQQWQDRNIFQEINEYLNNHSKTTINW